MNVTSFLYALIAGILPSLVWLFFWNREDADQPEPRTLLTACFFGGIIAVVVAIIAEQYVAHHIADQSYKYISWAAIEEVLKFAAVAFIGFRSKYFDEPIDAMIYAIAVALGFAALENSLFITGPLSNGEVITGIVTGNMRFIGATLVHVVSSSLVGFSIGYFFYRPKAIKAAASIIGLAAAITLHASFNLSIVGAGSADTLKAFGWIWGAVVIMIVLFEEVKAVRPHLD